MLKRNNKNLKVIKLNKKVKNQKKKLHQNKNKNFKELKIIRRKIVNKIRINHSKKMKNKMVTQMAKKENKILNIKKKIKELHQMKRRTSANKKEIKINFKRNEIK